MDLWLTAPSHGEVVHHHLDAPPNRRLPTNDRNPISTSPPTLPRAVADLGPMALSHGEVVSHHLHAPPGRHLSTDDRLPSTTTVSVCGLPCVQNFHVECINQWLWLNVKCPRCWCSVFPNLDLSALNILRPTIEHLVNHYFD
ncbi:hypothetical protein GUJ93_ZPchr0010g7773 [Zizania palustris]|uniref:RING-type domain-containing protein n=1 Tax=Zizania palustris TaxID=103762 RepID=A0A8J5W6D8_ZIZPA|nr:hypothetical protein GUJ93_ZPchr0010g7773 [Zizania palustris]